VIDRDALRDWLLRVRVGSQGYAMHENGEMDTRAAYCALVVMSLCGLEKEGLVEGVGDWIVDCQKWEGGLGGEPFNEAHGGYAFCGLAGLVILGEEKKLDLERFLVFGFDCVVFFYFPFFFFSFGR